MKKLTDDQVNEIMRVARYHSIEELEYFLKTATDGSRRNIIPRNAQGQFADHTSVEIKKKCEELARELYAAFPTVDIFDIQTIAIRSLTWIGSMTMLQEAPAIIAPQTEEEE